MAEYRLAETEAKFADIIWDHEPVPSGQLVKLCEQELSWKSTTTYTVLKRLCNRGIFKNRGSVVTSTIGREEFQQMKSRQFVEESFGGSRLAGDLHMERIYQWRTRYVGDASAVGNITDTWISMAGMKKTGLSL